MDHFGIGAAIEGAVRIYFHAARGTGRTRSLVESVMDGDRIVFATNQEAEFVRRQLREEGLDVQCTVVDPDRPGDLFNRPRSAKGRTIFDHMWIEAFYLNAIKRAQREIDEMEHQASGCIPNPHRETILQSDTVRKWRYP